MIISTRRLKLSVFLCVITLIPVMTFAFSDQTTTERIIKENKEFVEFINICLSNFARTKSEDFLKAYEKHFNGEVAFLQSDYRRAYKRVYSSQEDLVGLYEYTIRDLYLANSKDFLDRLAPSIIRSKNARARLYLTLGYRDRTISWTHYTIGEASNPRLFSYKIFKYEEGIKMARRAKRYGFLALFESQKDEVKRRIYMHLLKKEKEKGNIFFNRFIDLTEEQYIREMNRSVEELEKAENEKMKASGAAQSDEKKLERRVRFRKEKKAAEFLLNHDFDQAEDILRHQITDYNFKLIDAVLDVLSSMKGEATGGEAAIDYNALRIHLLDNYGRLSSESLLNDLTGRVRVEDAVEKLPDEIESEDLRVPRENVPPAPETHEPEAAPSGTGPAAPSPAAPATPAAPAAPASPGTR